MPNDARDRLRRLLLMLPTIADGREHTIAEVAAKLGVTREMLLADLQSVSQRLDTEGGYIETVQFTVDGEKISARTNPFRRPMRLTVAELCALELGLAVLRGERPAAEHGAIDRARLRLRHVISKMPAGEIPDGLRHATRGEFGSPQHLAAVQRALLAKRKLKIVYHGSGAERTARTICPYSLVASHGMFYLVAHCERSNGLRIFRLDRMEEVQSSAAGFHVPEDFSLAQVMEDGKPFFTERPAERMRVKYSPRIARWIAEREERPLAADGSLTMEHPLADRAWAVRHVLQYGPDAEVLEPAEVRDEIARRLRAMKRGTRRSAPRARRKGGRA